jgi:hypothetical protein
MTRLYVAVFVVGILLLAARIDVPTWTVRGSVGNRVTTRVTCVLPVNADDPSATPARAPEATAPDCESTTRDLMRTAWMTAC